VFAFKKCFTSIQIHRENSVSGYVIHHSDDQESKPNDQINRAGSIEPTIQALRVKSKLIPLALNELLDGALAERAH
jgi:hypothetical protein